MDIFSIFILLFKLLAGGILTARKTKHTYHQPTTRKRRVVMPSKAAARSTKQLASQNNRLASRAVSVKPHCMSNFNLNRRLIQVLT
jgi:ribosomal protein S21